MSVITGDHKTDSGPARSRREEAAIAVFGSWMIGGLFLDGWAHGAQKPESFFTPWHGILYSGFVAAVVWFAWDGWRADRSGEARTGPADPLVLVGLVVFIVGAIGDGIWHTVFGVEVNLEALVSPSHLTLFGGGFLMVTAPVRAEAAHADSASTARWRTGFPQMVTITLAAALVAFFTEYLSVFDDVASVAHNRFYNELLQIDDLASILVTNVILVVPLLYVLWRWRPPVGAFAMLFTTVAFLTAGLDGFRRVELVLAFALGGLVADLAVARRARPLVVAVVASLATWAGFFVVADASYGVGWSPELWSGAIVLTAFTSAVLAAVMRPVQVGNR